MKICLRFPLLARAVKMNHKFLVVSREHDWQEYGEEEQKRISGGNRGLEVGGWGSKVGN